MPTVSDFLLERLSNSGVKHIFGVPGDYILSFYKKVNDSNKIDLINSTDESHAGFSADAYARVNGIGCVCVTYNVGALKVTNAVACAYAERSPMVVISGSPGMKERGEGVLLHHMVRSFECQKQIFDNITCASIILDDPNTAAFKIDDALHKLQECKQPIYIELPRDISEQSISYDVYKQGTPKKNVSDEENLAESIEESKNWLNEAKNPVILAGIQLSRFGLGSKLVKFAEKNNFPICTTLLSKSVVGEKHQLFKGVYMGAASHPEIKDLVENSDCLLMFGVLLTDVTLGFLPSKFKKRRIISASIEDLKIRNHIYSNVLFVDFCESLFKLELQSKAQDVIISKTKLEKFVPQKDQRLTTPRLFEKINSILTEKMAIVADIGDSLFGAADLVVHHKNHFISPAFYTSMGYAIPGAVGVQLADPEVRPIVIVGDGAFQMSCTELSTMIRKKLNPIVIVLNNDGYATERCLIEGSFNDLYNWDYHKITEMLRGGVGLRVTNEDELESALECALISDELFVINAMVDPDVISLGLKRMTEGLAKKV